MSVLVLSQAEVEELLDMKGCIGAMEAALLSLARGELHQPLRFIVRPPEESNLIGLMPAHRSGMQPLYSLKTVCVFPDNPQRGLDAHQGTVTLFDGDTGETQALLNASAITAIRTAACSAVATRLLAREDAAELAIVGAGVQARSHLEALPLVRSFQRVRIAGRDRDRVAALAAEFPGAVVSDTVDAAVRNADVIVTATNSSQPVLRREWLKPGVHINAVGSCFPHTRELDAQTVAASGFFVDRRESTQNEAGDYLLALRDGAIAEGHIRAELGDVLAGTSPGRLSEDEITVFESLGLAVEDLFAAEYVVRRAREAGRGTDLEF